MSPTSHHIGLYPGTFDIPTNGHLNLIHRGARLFSTLYVAVANNATKKPLLSVDERLDLLRRITRDQPNVHVASFEGLTVDFAREVGAQAIIRGLRAVSDFEYELQMALLNQKMAPEIETIYLAPALENTFLSSSMIQEIMKMGGDISPFVPPEVEAYLRTYPRPTPETTQTRNNKPSQGDGRLMEVDINRQNKAQNGGEDDSK